MYCTKCGTEIDDEAIICPACGCKTANFTLVVTPKEEVKTSNGIAVAGFICSFFIPLLGWVFGGIGLARANKRNGKGKGFSIASIIIATVMFFAYCYQYL
ncbi:MAG: zinc-ribbon domain-containing protein [Clostridia bacterium]|nr:zinc-ribbon domain-containing protein [Clostridia bacterium]